MPEMGPGLRRDDKMGAAGGDREMGKAPTRRTVSTALGLLGARALGGVALSGLGIVSARAQGKPLKLALIAPLSGPWARQGQLMRMGAEMALEEINAGGGIKAL